MITFEDFKKLEIKIGKIISVEKIPEADNLIKLEIDFGTEKRQVVAGIAQFYEPDYLIGKKIPVIVNLEPRKLRGVESQGMILAVSAEGTPVLLYPEKDVPLGSIVK